METKRGRPIVPAHKCSDCNYETKNTTALKKHYLDMHAPESERLKGYKYYCNYCKVGFMGPTELDNHEKTRRHIRISENS